MATPEPPPPSTTAAASTVAQAESVEGSTRWPAPVADSICGIDDALTYAASARPYRRQAGDPMYRMLRIYSRDPGGSRLAGNEVLVRVPYEPLGPGPQGSMMRVDLADPSGSKLRAAELDDPRVLIESGYRPSGADPCFHAQMVYAVSKLTYASFQVALGRDPAWAFPPGGAGQVLTLRPFGLLDDNAYYDRSERAIVFGFSEVPDDAEGRFGPDSYLFTSLSHDVIVHETTHALLDGMRARFLVPTRPDVLAFHEGFSDLVAIFQRFSHKVLVREAIRGSAGCLSRAQVLFQIAREFGQTLGRSSLRTGIEWASDCDLARPDGAKVTTYDACSKEPHALGTVLVSAVFDAFDTVYQRKIAPLLRIATGRSVAPREFEPTGDLLDLLANEASKLAAQFLNLLIRAVDYCPPVDLTFGEYLRALLTADHELIPEDPWGYREALIDAFALRRIAPSGVFSLSEDALRWQPPSENIGRIEELSFANLEFASDPARPASAGALRDQAEALARVVSHPDHHALFGIWSPTETCCDAPRIHSIRTTNRVGPDGQSLFDLVAEITQRHRVDTARGSIVLYSGSTVVIGPDGAIRFVVGKGLPGHRGSERHSVDRHVERLEQVEAATPGLHFDRQAMDPEAASMPPDPRQAPLRALSRGSGVRAADRFR